MDTERKGVMEVVMEVVMEDGPQVGTMWLNYMLPASSLLCLPILATVKEQYNRTQLDEDKQV